MAGRLHVCAVPIGNLEDASPRLRRVLGEVDAIACEDTRTTRKLLGLLGIEPVPRLLAHHAHNERAGAAGIVALLEDGLDVALVSDAGTPVVSDPGAHVVDAAHAAGVEVVAVPGPSAMSAALSIAGFHGAPVTFVEFLPRGGAPVAQLAQARAHEIMVAFEAPGRVAESLAAVAQVQGDRRIAVCRELTKRFEQVDRGTTTAVAARWRELEPRGEFVLVLDALPQQKLQAASATHVQLALELVAEGLGTKAAARIVAEHLGGSKRELYDALLESRDD